MYNVYLFNGTISLKIGGMINEKFDLLTTPWYWVMRRPVDHIGQKNDFYGTKTESFKGPFAGEAGKARAEQIASAYNKAFHIAYVRD